jgi:colanic acid/amylovoran biosynthesis glycosyltransferase
MTAQDVPSMRIAYVVKRYPRFSETFIVNEILAHEAAGQDIHVFALHPPVDQYFQAAIAKVRAPVTYLTADSVRADGLWSQLQQAAGEWSGLWTQLSAAGKASGNEVYQAARLALEIRARGIDHLHAHFASTATTVARLASLFTGIPYTFTAHAKDIFHEAVDSVDLGHKIDCAAGAVTVSDFNVEYLAAQFDGSANKLRRIYNGLDLAQFEFSKPDRRPPKIVAVGRLVEKKGFDDLIRACALLREEGVGFQCEIVGGGELERALRQCIADLHLDGIVQLSGPRPLTYVQDAIRQAAVLAVPSVTASSGDRDGLPTVLLEAMALGTPCVATSVTGIPEAIRDGATGLLVPERQPAELASAIKRLMLDVGLRMRLAAAARRVVEQQFDIRQNAAKLREFFLSCGKSRVSPLSLAEVG